MKILCVTYTNHALDDFLHGLVKEGIKSIIRIGGKVNDPAVLPYTLMEKKNISKPKRWTRETNQRCDSLKRSLQAINSKIAAKQEELKLTSAKSLTKSWSIVQQYLDEEMDPALEFLSPKVGWS